MAEELLLENIKLNKTKSSELSKHLQALEQLRKIFKTIMKVNTPKVLTAPTASHFPTYKTFKTTLQTHE